jgi:hypothetical protein
VEKHELTLENIFAMKVMQIAGCGFTFLFPHIANNERFWCYALREQINRKLKQTKIEKNAMCENTRKKNN